jgi:hypothetical protein
VGDRFAAGVLLHTGALAYRISDRVIAAPISALWASPARAASPLPPGPAPPDPARQGPSRAAGMTAMPSGRR